MGGVSEGCRMNVSVPLSQLDSPSPPAPPLLDYCCCIEASAPSPLICVCLSVCRSLWERQDLGQAASSEEVSSQL